MAMVVTISSEVRADSLIWFANRNATQPVVRGIGFATRSEVTLRFAPTGITGNAYTLSQSKNSFHSGK